MEEMSMNEGVRKPWLSGGINQGRKSRLKVPQLYLVLRKLRRLYLESYSPCDPASPPGQRFVTLGVRHGHVGSLRTEMKK